MRMRITAALGLVLAAGSARGATFTMGPDGDYTTLQLAVGAAVAAGGDNEVRVQAGSYAQRLSLFSLPSGSLTITGGWDAAFATRQTDPGATVFDGGGAGRVFDLWATGGTLKVEGLTVRNGIHAISGGGVNGTVQKGLLVLAQNVVEESRAEDGGGVYVNAQGLGEVVVQGNVLRSNVGTARGAGLSVRALGDATFTVRDNRIEGNRLECCTTGSGSGGGVFIKLQERPVVNFWDNLIQGNEVTGTATFQGDGGALWFFTGCNAPPTPGPLDCTSATLDARRNRWLDNLGNVGAFQDHVSLRAETAAGFPSTLLFTDSVVAGGDGVGVGYFAFAESTLHMTNLTITDHLGTGIVQRNAATEATTTLYNTIVYGNQPETSVTNPDQGNNRIGEDPLFVDAAGGDFALEPGSPGIDAGDDAPPGGLGPFDLEGNPRIAGAAVNIGAVERVPEPGGWLLRGSALGAVAGLVRRRRTRAARDPGERARRGNDLPAASGC